MYKNTKKSVNEGFTPCNKGLNLVSSTYKEGGFHQKSNGMPRMMSFNLASIV